MIRRKNNNNKKIDKKLIMPRTIDNQRNERTNKQTRYTEINKRQITGKY